MGTEGLTVKSIEALKEWNDSPTDEKVYVVEWFYEHMFENLLTKEKYEEAKILYDEMVRFTSIYEKMAPEDSEKRMIENILFWDKRASYYLGSEKLNEIFKT